MSVRVLDEQQASQLRGAPLSYTPHQGPVGDAPPGYTLLNRSVTLSRRDFDGVARDLFAWRMHSRAGLQVRASDVPLREGTVVLMQWGLGRLSVKIPVAWSPSSTNLSAAALRTATCPAIQKPAKKRFLLEQGPAGDLLLTITAYSRPASALAKVAGPISRAAQSFMTERYLQALDRL